MKRVNAVVVTYNRCELLKECVEKLLKQSYAINKLIIVDNNSDDGTIDYLKSLKDEKVEIVFLKKNLGGAGGFYHGIKNACRFEADYVWLMDDDTICTENALKELIYALDVLKDEKVGFLSSNVLFKDDSPCMMNIPGPVYVWNKYIYDKIAEIRYTSFVSMLIPIDVVKKVGLPVKEYFIWGDDGDYSRRILREHTGYLVGGSTVYHYMKENVGVDIINTDINRIERFFYFYRNTFASKIREGKKNAFLFWGKSQYTIVKIIFSKTKCKVKKIWTIDKGLLYGFFMKYKIDYVD